MRCGGVLRMCVCECECVCVCECECEWMSVCVCVCVCATHSSSGSKLLSPLTLMCTPCSGSTGNCSYLPDNTYIYM